MFPKTETFVASGLEYATEKSRPLKADGRWLVDSFKFLSNTVLTGTKEPLTFPETAAVAPDTLTIIGTPRSGVVNQPLPAETHTALRKRDAGLWSILRSKATKGLFGSYRHPAALLAAWGRSESPAALIPYEFIKGEKATNKSFLYALAKAAKSLPTVAASSATGSPTVSPALAARLSTLFSQGKHDTIAWLTSRYAGLQQSLLYSPDLEDTMPETHNKIYEPKPGANLRKGPNMISLLAKSRRI